MSSPRLFAASVIMLSAILINPLHAESGSPWWKIWETADQTANLSNRLFTDNEKRILNDYLRSQLSDDDDDERDGKHKDKKHKKDKHNKQKSLPPGLQKKVERGGELPPGWQKKIARGEVLEGDLYRASSNLPHGILDQLNSVEGTSVRQLEDQVVRILDSSGEILDVLSGRR